MACVAPADWAKLPNKDKMILAQIWLEVRHTNRTYPNVEATLMIEFAQITDNQAVAACSIEPEAYSFSNEESKEEEEDRVRPR
mmetsp:Transcript_15680/g.11414  ORF Transcript_15680/g.11414 Transcript_15680/m.11414 type:complete len:83 (-) Transcript_15680:3658-3906(-)